MKNYIFHLHRDQAYDEAPPQDLVMIDGPLAALRHQGALRAHLGLGGYTKLLVKSLTGNRLFFFLDCQGRLSSCGYLSLGFCRHYAVRQQDVVIGSIWTDPALRGQGLASRSIRAAINHMIGQGYRSFFIDTQEGNIPMLKSINNLGFGPACGQFEC